MNSKSQSILPWDQWMPLREISFKYNESIYYLVYYRIIKPEKLDENRISGNYGLVCRVEEKYPLDTIDNLLLEFIRQVDPEAHIHAELLKTKEEQDAKKSFYRDSQCGEIKVSIGPTIFSELTEAQKKRFEKESFFIEIPIFKVHSFGSHYIPEKIPIIYAYPLDRSEEFKLQYAELNKTVRFI